MRLLSVFVLLTASSVVRADAFDWYYNEVLTKAPMSKNVTKVDQLTPELMVRHSLTLPQVPGAFFIVKTNQGRMAKVLAQPARHRIDGENSLPILYIERFVTFRDGDERTVDAQGKNVRLYDGFRFNLDIGQVVPESLQADIRFVGDKDKIYVEPVGKAEIYLVTKHFAETTPKKAIRPAIGQKFEPRFFNGTYKLYDDGRRAGTMTLIVSVDGDVSGHYYSDKDGQKYDVSGKVGTPNHTIQFKITLPRTIVFYHGWMFTGDGAAITGTSRLEERETGFYAVRQDKE